jgi:uncharacterized protein HemY
METMFSWTTIGKSLVLVGLLLALLGGLILAGGKIPWIGKLPGDILIRKKNFTFYFPLTTGIIISIILSLLFWFLNRK